MSSHPASPSCESPPYARSDRSLSPRIVYYEVTQAIEWLRSDCPWRPRIAPHGDELSSRQSRALLAQLAGFPKPPSVVLVGGDPFEREDLAELVAFGTARGLEIMVSAAPTSRVTRTRLADLRSAGVVRLSVELDGPTAGIHDSIHGAAGLFRRAMRMAVTARIVGLSLQVNTRLTPDNVEYLEMMARLVAGLDIDLWAVQFLVPIGSSSDQTRLSGDECEQVFERLFDLARRAPFLVKVCDAPHYRRYVVRRQTREWIDGDPVDVLRLNPWTSLGLNDGRGLMFISHAGLIQPGPYLPLVCGSFPQDDVIHVYQNSPVFRALRDPTRLKGKCHWCEFHGLCGGSRARAYAVTGDAFNQEPDCDYMPRALG